ncbi:MAG TPA: NAD(P)/FAD-dependent oxidoreductase, partial [Actinomycetes bacterium]|nr:NAD(P)/FAD-dependent oxidoreductase [Actinomycetes bacterium]
MSSNSTFVIVGAGMAGALTAQALRDEGFDGRLLLVGNETDRPYERPPLSKNYLMGTAERESVFVHPADWYAKHDVELRTDTTVTAIDVERREVILDAGEVVTFDQLALATGAEPRRLNIPGADLDGVRYLRRISDSEHLRSDFSRVDRVAIIGGGWIGLETAAAARTAGVEVTLLEQGPLPLQQILGAEIAQVFASLHRANGVDLRGNVEVVAIEGESGVVTGVRLSDGEVVAAGLVIVGVGVLPNVSLAERAG